MSLTNPRDLTNGAVGGVALPPAVYTASAAGDPPVAVDMIRGGDALCTLSVLSGAINAATGISIQVVESDTGLTGSWGNVVPSMPENAFPGTITFSGATAGDPNSRKRTGFQRTKRFLGVRVTLTGGTLSAALAADFDEPVKYTPV